MIPKSHSYQLVYKETGAVIVSGSKSEVLKVYRRDYQRPGFELRFDPTFNPGQEVK